jgi:gas vesicle protein
MNNQNKNLLTFLFGAAIGAAVAWLFTSEDGKKIVAETKEKAKQWKDELGDKFNSENPNNKQTS